MTQQNKRTVKPFNRSTIQHALAFTLAEVLIVIGIIGVVAALTLPNLNHATGDKETITRVKKIYSVLNEAYDRAQVIYGDAAEWANYANENALDPQNVVADRISEFMKISKKNGNTITLSDGLEFHFGNFNTPHDSIYYPGLKYLGSIWVDINGENKGKNELGKDQFKFDILDQGIYPEGINAESLQEWCFAYGYCTKWIIDNDNMDYLKADENGNCKDSNIALDGVNNTSCH